MERLDTSRRRDHLGSRQNMKDMDDVEFMILENSFVTPDMNVSSDMDI